MAHTLTDTVNIKCVALHDKKLHDKKVSEKTSFIMFSEVVK